jgi:hypothetical protein
MQQSRELLQQSLTAVPLRSPVIIYVEKSGGRLHELPASVSFNKLRCIEVEFRLKPAFALLRIPGCLPRPLF